MNATATAPPHIYDLHEMPRVDAHVHIPFPEAPDDREPFSRGEAHEAADAFVKIMDESRIAVCVNLSGNREMVDAADTIHQTWKNRILFAPAAWDVREGLWWSEEDLPRFKEAGCAGIKIWVQYRKGFTEESIQAKIRRQGEVGLPLIGLHIANPQEGKWDHPDYWEYIQQAEGVLRAQPNVTFIMAHGFWLMNNDKALDVLTKYFDEFPHLNADLSAVFQYWTPPQPTYDKLREFIIHYQDRLLFGTDGNPKYSTPGALRLALQGPGDGRDGPEGLLQRQGHQRPEAADRGAQSHLLLERGSSDSPCA